MTSLNKNFVVLPTQEVVCRGADEIYYLRESHNCPRTLSFTRNAILGRFLATYTDKIFYKYYILRQFIVEVSTNFSKARFSERLYYRTEDKSSKRTSFCLCGAPTVQARQTRAQIQEDFEIEVFFRQVAWQSNLPPECLHYISSIYHIMRADMVGILLPIYTT